MAGTGEEIGVALDVQGSASSTAHGGVGQRHPVFAPGLHPVGGDGPDSGLAVNLLPLRV